MRAGSKKELGLIVGIVVAVLALAVAARFFTHHNVAILQPAGTIGHQERNLLFLALGLCAIVVIPVFTLTIFIALKYREANERPKKYQPDWDGDRRLELTWWAIPGVIIAILAIVTWFSSYHLDPYRALAATNKPMNVDVVALDWKWLFIYPDQNIATVNYARIPLNTPVDFHITSDTVMNSFWVPNLGGQIYAMPGMATQLHLMASKAGDYPGSSANISGDGFARMTFTIASSSESNFTSWVSSVKRSTQQLDLKAYRQLATPSVGSPVVYYSHVVGGLFTWSVEKYMVPAGDIPNPGTPAFTIFQKSIAQRDMGM